MTIDRRQFNKLTAAALGGLVSGTAVGCSGKKGDKGKDGDGGKKDGGKKDGDKKGAGSGEVGDQMVVAEKNVCRGLNACKDKGTGTHECAGQGTCATAKAHSCHKENECKGQGGCEDSVGINDCKGKGACAVPLSDGAWKKARARFEAQMKKAGKSVGDAPAKPAEKNS